MSADIMCVVGSVVRKDDSILFVRQTYGNLRDMWTLPWGRIEGRQATDLDSARGECDRYCYWLAKRVFSGRYSELTMESESPYSPLLGLY